MATSKTLTPTNQTISIPALGDAPDASVFSNCIEKEADAINTLNSQIGTYDVGTNTLANIESALATYADTLGNNEFKNVKFSVSPATGLFGATTYFGVLRKISTGRYNISVQGLLDPTQTIYGNYRNSAWAWDNPFSQLEDKIPTPLRLDRKAENTNSWTFHVPRYSRNSYSYFLLVGGTSISQGFLYHGFVHVGGNDAVGLTLIGGTAVAGITGAYNESNETLTITTTNTNYGGMRLIWLS